MSDPAVPPAIGDPDLPETARRVHGSIETLTASVNALSGRIRRSEVRTYILAGSLVLDVVLTVVIAVLGVRVENASDCQAAQNDAFQSISLQLRDAAAKERAAQRALFDIVLDPTSSPERRRQATVDYQATLIEADIQRADSPFPTGNCS